METRICQYDFHMVKSREYQEMPRMAESSDAYMLLESLGYATRTEEVVVGLLVNARCEIISVIEFGTGNDYLVSINPADMYKKILKSNCTRFIIAHNHPSGTLVPSQADIDFCDSLVEGSKILGLQMLDFMIITEDDRFSFAEEKLLPNKDLSFEEFIEISRGLDLNI